MWNKRRRLNWKDLFRVSLSFIHLLSVRKGGLGTLWGDLTFCHQADCVPCRLIPFKPPTHSTLHDGTEAFRYFPNLWVSENWAPEMEENAPSRQWNEKTKTHQKSQSNCRNSFRVLCYGLTSIWSRVFSPHEISLNKVRLSPQNCQKLLFSVSKRWSVLVGMTQVIMRSLAHKISSVRLAFPCKNSRIWMKFDQMEAGDTRLCDSGFREMYCGFGNDGQVPWAKAVFYSHLGCYTDNTLVYQLLWVAHREIKLPHI